MGELHQPDLEPGPHRDLVEALHRLHREAGRPSLRAIARRAGCSHTTVFHVLCHPHLPAWELLELVVPALSGQPAELRPLWLAATAEGIRHVPAPARTIAGRRAELLVVRRHLEAGSGLLLVVGEDGIGKTTLVDTASQQVSTFVAHARGVPLLSGAPFALVADVLREVGEVDEGRWLAEALSTCPAFVRPSLARILPELRPGATDGVTAGITDGDDRFARDRLLAAVECTLAALAALRPLALVLEDLDAADPSSRSCLEMLVVGGGGVPVVGTLRPGGSAVVDAWLMRVRREATLVINLPPLTEKESREQLRLLVGRWLSRGELDRMHRVTEGVPLFTEELARAMPLDELPERLDDLFVRDLDGLTPSARAVLVVAAVADRALPASVLATVASMGEAELADARRELVTRHLLAGPYGTSDVAVRHPLLGATVRTHLLPGEGVSAHRRLALALAGTTHPSPAEIAEHWREAEDTREELPWRVAAARTACDRLSPEEEAVHWDRAHELWPVDGPAPPDAATTRPDLLLEVVHAGSDAGRPVAASILAEARSLAGTLRAPDHALSLRRASHALADLDPDSAVALAGEAATTFDALGDRVGTVRAMRDQSRALRGAGRYEEADAVVAAALALSDDVREPALHRDVLIERAWLDIAAGRVLAGLRAANAASLMPIEGDPFGEVWLGTYHTDLLLMLCAGGDEVAQAASSGLAAARDAGIESFVLSTLLVCNVAEARIGEGATASAARLVRPLTQDAPRQATRFLHLTRAWTEVARGDLETADRRLGSVAELVLGTSAHRQGLLTVQAMCDLWRDLPALALDHIGDGIAGESATSWSPSTGALLLLAARAAADVARAHPTRRRELAGTLASWRSQWSEDPFSPDAPHAATSASRSTWRAELGRLTGSAHVADWVGAAEQWDLVGRPHDAAYCRWRAAELALHEGDRARAGRLLRRAHAQARGHVPLLRAVEGCRAAAPAAPEAPPRQADSSSLRAAAS